MNIHEYQGKDILKSYGVRIQEGIVVDTPALAVEAARELTARTGTSWHVIKAQIHAGGRGKGGGVKLAKNLDEVRQKSEEILGMQLITHQTGPEGKKVSKVLIAEDVYYPGVSEVKEYYISILLDRGKACNVIMASTEGGVEIEHVAETNPDAIVRLPVDPAWGLADFEIRDAIKRAYIPKEAAGQMVQMIKKLVKAYIEEDADMIEINPVALTPDGKLIAADAKVSIDESALFRHKEYDETSSDSADNAIEAEAMRRGIAYVNLGGEIGIMANGAGLTMQSLDEVNAAGGKPANFLDVGGGAKAERVKSCVELILMDPNVKGLMINIFGGITRVDEVAKGVLEAFSQMDVKIPVVARIEGTAVEEGRKILQGSQIIAAATVEEAAKKIVELAYA